MLKTISAIAVAAFAAAAFIAFPGLSPQVEAGTPAPVVKSDRLDIRPLGVACSQQAWPNFERRCLRDQRAVKGQTNDVRRVSIDRLAALGSMLATR
jgi:hypothetical protein